MARKTRKALFVIDRDRLEGKPDRLGRERKPLLWVVRYNFAEGTHFAKSLYLDKGFLMEANGGRLPETVTVSVTIG